MIDRTPFRLWLHVTGLVAFMTLGLTAQIDGSETIPRRDVDLTSTTQGTAGTTPGTFQQPGSTLAQDAGPAASADAADSAPADDPADPPAALVLGIEGFATAVAESISLLTSGIPVPWLVASASPTSDGRVEVLVVLAVQRSQATDVQLLVACLAAEVDSAATWRQLAGASQPADLGRPELAVPESGASQISPNDAPARDCLPETPPVPPPAGCGGAATRAASSRQIRGSRG